jgi:hypothetical protein
MLPGDDVVYLKGQRVAGGRELTVLAPFAGALSNLLNQLRVH